MFWSGVAFVTTGGFLLVVYYGVIRPVTSSSNSPAPRTMSDAENENRGSEDQPATVPADPAPEEVLEIDQDRVEAFDQTVFAGTGDAAYDGDGGPAVQADLWGPRGIDVDAGGNVYFAAEGNHAIRRVDTDGIITTIAGNGTGGCGKAEGRAQEVQLLAPKDVAIDSHGFAFIADPNCN